MTYLLKYDIIKLPGGVKVFMNKSSIYDYIILFMSYFIFAISLIGVNMVNYKLIKVGFYILMVISAIISNYSCYLISKDKN